MAVVETERHGQILVVRMNRPERLNALNHEMRTRLAETWTEFRHSNELEVAIFTGAGRGFCAGEDMKESLAARAAGRQPPRYRRPVHDRDAGKAGHRRGQRLCDGRRLYAGRTHRSAGRGARGRCSRSRRPSAGCSAATITGTSRICPTRSRWRWRSAFASPPNAFTKSDFSTAWSSPIKLIPSAIAMAEHLLTLPPASRVNTVHMMRQMRPVPSPEQQRLADALHEHGAKSDLIESRAAFAEKRPPNFKGWDDPEDRYRLPDARDGPARLTRGAVRATFG